MLPGADVETDKKRAWSICAELATRQDGVVARGQLLEAGLSTESIKGWVRRGMLHRRYNGVYSVGHRALAPLGRERAALLACGAGAVLSHSTAAHLWRLRGTPPVTLDVTVLGRQCRPRPGLRVHQVAELPDQDLRRKADLPLTSPARTLIDLAAHVRSDELERLVSEARATRLLGAGELEAALERAGHRRGVAAMRGFLAGEAEPDFTFSQGERKLRRLLREAALPQPRTNIRLASWRVDFFWEDAKLVVEFDGFQFHGHRRAFENDRRKDVILANLGYQVLRFTWRRLEREPIIVIAAIAQALGRRSRVPG